MKSVTETEIKVGLFRRPSRLVTGEESKGERCLVATSPWRLQTTRDELYLSGLVGERHRDTLTPERERETGTPLERNPQKRRAAAAAWIPGSARTEEEKQQKRWRREGRGGGGGEAGVKFVQVCTSLRKRHFDSSPHRSNFATSLLLVFVFTSSPSTSPSSPSTPPPPPSSSSSPRCLGASSPTPTKSGVSLALSRLHRSAPGLRGSGCGRRSSAAAGLKLGTCCACFSDFNGRCGRGGTLFFSSPLRVAS